MSYIKSGRGLPHSWHTLNNEETSELLYHRRKTGGGTKKVNRILQIVLLHLNSQIWWWCILRAWRKQGYSSRRLGEGREGVGRGWLSADSATLINVIWSWQWTPNSSRPWSSCRSPLPVPNSPNYRNIAQQIKCGVICRLPWHFITHSWQRVRGPLLDCLTWHLAAVPFIIVCIYRNERAGYFVRPVIKSSRGKASSFFPSTGCTGRFFFPRCCRQMTVRQEGCRWGTLPPPWWCLCGRSESANSIMYKAGIRSTYWNFWWNKVTFLRRHF